MKLKPICRGSDVRAVSPEEESLRLELLSKLEGPLCKDGRIRKPRRTIKHGMFVKKIRRCPACSKLFIHQKKVTCSTKCRFDKLWRKKVLRYKDKSGYWIVFKPNHPRARNRKGWIFEHRVLMEEKLGRILDPKEFVHHIDGDPGNNKIENLMLVDNATHKRIHWNQKTEKERLKMMTPAWTAHKDKWNSI